MSGPFGSSQWMYNAGSSFYPVQINDSLRFENGSSAYLNRTPSSAGNRRTWTWSGWVKRSNIGINSFIFGCGSSGTNFAFIGFDSANKIDIRDYQGSYTYSSKTSQLFRDTSAWYHLVLTADMNNSTAADRIKLYVNGERVTSFDSAPSPTTKDLVTNSAIQHVIGAGYYNDGSGLNSYFDGYLSDINFIDGQSLDATSFGETKDGVWIPKSYSGSYGTNGFHLEFNGNTNDTSGNSNNWTANNISAHDYVPDSPTNNFGTWNYLSSTNLSYAVTQDGSLKANMGTGTGTGLTGTFSCKGGKWYWENRASNVGNALSLGITTGSATTSDMNSKGIFYDIYGNKRVFGTTTGSAGATFAANDIIGMAVDAESAGTIAFYKNNALQFTVTESSILTDDFLPWIFNNSSSAGSLSYINFGQDSTFAGATTAGGNADDNGVGDFKYAPPSGFLSLCSANLPEPVVGPLGDSISTDNFNTVLYTGNGVQDTTISGVGFQPDWVWIKDRTGANHHILFDSVRGGTKQLFSTLINSEQTNTDLTNGFASDGFIVGDNVTGTGATNLNNNTYASWNWKAGGSASSNSDGSITSSVSANTDAGFSIVSWSGVGASAGATVGHGLNQAPELILPKNRGDIGNWHGYVSELGGTKGILLNATNAVTTDAGFWNNTNPTSSVFTVGTYNVFNYNYIAYCFHSVQGYSKVGSYTGNGTNQFIYTGFRPAFVMSKVTSGADNWRMYDSARIGYNPNNRVLYPNLSNAEDAVTNHVDLLSNGFRWMSDNNNANGHTFIYLAFAENPFKYANAR